MKRILAMHVSDSVCSALALEGASGAFGSRSSLQEKFEVSRFFHKKIPLGSVENGALRDPEALRNFFQSAVQEHKVVFSERKIAFSVPDARTFTTSFQVMKFQKEDAELILKRAQEDIPQDLAQTFWDYRLVPGRTEDFFVFFAAIDKSYALQWSAFFHDVGLTVVFFTLEPENVIDAFPGDIPPERTVLVADIGARTTDIFLTEHRFIRLSNVLSVGGDTLTRAIAAKTHKTYHAAEATKKSLGLSDARVKSAVTDSIDQIARAIKRMQSYAKEKYQKDVSHIVLAGGASLTPLLKECVQEKVREEIVIGDPMRHIANSSVFGRTTNPIFFSTVIGLATSLASGKNMIRIVAAERVPARRRWDATARIGDVVSEVLHDSRFVKVLLFLFLVGLFLTIVVS